MRDECNGKLLRLATGEAYYGCSVDNIIRPYTVSTSDECPICHRKITAIIERNIPTRVITEPQGPRVINVKQILYQEKWLTVS